MILDSRAQRDVDARRTMSGRLVVVEQVPSTLSRCVVVKLLIAIRVSLGDIERLMRNILQSRVPKHNAHVQHVVILVVVSFDERVSSFLRRCPKQSAFRIERGECVDVAPRTANFPF